MPATNPDARTVKKMSHLFRLIFRLPQLLEPEEFLNKDNESIFAPSPLGKAVATVGIVPFWLKECPPKHAAQWGARWAAIREKLVELASTNVKGEIDKFDWVKAGLRDVSTVARAEAWDSCLDSLITRFLEDEGLSIQSVYQNPSNYERVYKNGNDSKGFLSSTTWDSQLGDYLPRLLGPAVHGDSQLIPEPAISWWHATIQAHLDAASKQRSRCDASLAKSEATVAKLFGPNFLKAGIPVGFNVGHARKGLKALKTYKANLAWQLISPEDVQIMSESITANGSEGYQHLEQRWASLTPNARKMEFCQVAIGWMTGVIQAKSGVEDDEEAIDFGGERDQELVRYGIALGRKIPKRQLKDHFVEPSPSAIAQFNLEVADFTDLWLGRSQVDNLDTAAALYRNPELEVQLQQYLNEGEDIGVAPFQKMTPEELHTYLGYPPDRSLPVGFRKFTADDPRLIPSGVKDEPFEGSSSVVLSWHQLVFVAVLFSHLTSGQKADLTDLHHSGVPGPDDAIQAIQEEWARVPGTCLFDEVGLGKTLCCLAGIASLQHAYLLQEGWKQKGTTKRDSLPACIRDCLPFGSRLDGIPNNAHLIVVPPSLVDQWATEIRRFFRDDAIRLVIVRTASKNWRDDMDNIRKGAVGKIWQIVLVSHSILQRMFSTGRARIQKKMADDMPRLVYKPPLNTLFSFSWCSTWVDEAHDGRTGKALWRGLSAILDVSLCKILMTATPLLEQPEDLLNLAVLVRPPSMNWKEHANMRFMGRDLRLVKGRSVVKTHQDALLFGAGDRIVAQTEGGAVALLSSTMVQVAQRHLVPHTVRRSNKSLDYAGKLLSASLPPCTILHVSVQVTDEESQASYNELGKDEVTGRHFNVATLGRFFNEGRQKLSFPNPERWKAEEYDAEAFNSDSATKLKCLIELIRAILTRGADSVVPQEYHGTQDAILGTQSFGLPDLIKQYRVQQLKPEEINSEKVIVYTTFAKFHLHMVAAMKAGGITAVAISGGIPARERTKIIERFNTDAKVNVLLMSVVGQTGLNLTRSRVMILYEATWSGVQAEQIHGRINRRGQKHPTFIFQLMAADTVEVLLLANGLGKHQLLGDFLKVKRNEATLKLLSGRATEAEVDAFLERQDAGDELAAEVKDQLKSAKSIVGVAMLGRNALIDDEAEEEPQKKQKPKRKNKRKEKPADEGDDSTKVSKRKAKSAPARSDKEEGPSKKKRRAVGNLAPGPSQGIPMDVDPDDVRTDGASAGNIPGSSATSELGAAALFSEGQVLPADVPPSASVAPSEQDSLASSRVADVAPVVPPTSDGPPGEAVPPSEPSASHTDSGFPQTSEAPIVPQPAITPAPLITEGTATPQPERPPALGANGELLNAEDIDFYDSEGDDIPLPKVNKTVEMDMESMSTTSSQSGPPGLSLRDPPPRRPKPNFFSESKQIPHSEPNALDAVAREYGLMDDVEMADVGQQDGQSDGEHDIEQGLKDLDATFAADEAAIEAAEDAEAAQPTRPSRRTRFADAAVSGTMAGNPADKPRRTRNSGKSLPPPPVDPPRMSQSLNPKGRGAKTQAGRSNAQAGSSTSRPTPKARTRP